jgi:hypothetical protein
MASPDDTHDAADDFFEILGRLIDLGFVVVIDGEPELTPTGQDVLVQIVACTTPKTTQAD